MERGERIAGRYELVRRLGRGGMGEVWAARDHNLHRDVALKLLVLDDGLAPDLPARFEREAVAAAQISHPNVVALYDRGVHEGVLFLVMEKVDGPPLSRIIHQESGLEPGRVLRIADGICAALAAAHTAGIVHYDIKPHNVMLTSDGQVKVVDFGIAGFLQTAFSLVRSSQLAPAGTPEYAAPEQFGAERGDKRSDLYALGGVLFVLLTGRPPYTGHSALALMAQKIGEDAPRLDAIRPGLPTALTDLVARLLERDPGRRPGSAEEVRQLLRRASEEGDDSDPGTGPGSTEESSGPLSELPPALVPAVELVCRIDDREKQIDARVRVAEAVVTTAPDAAGRVLAGVPAVQHCLILLGLADEATDPGHSRQLFEQAERLIEGLPPDHEASPLVSSAVAWYLTRHAPERAVPWLDRVERVAHDDRGAPEEMVENLAELAGRVSGTHPERAVRLMARVEQLARRLPPDPEIAFSLPWQLVRIAAAGRAADPGCAERLIDLAEERARGVETTRQRRSALKWTAETVAAFDPQRAERIVGAMPPEDRASAWTSALRSASITDTDVVPLLLDLAERNALELQVSQEVRTPRGPLGLFGSSRQTVTGPDRYALRRTAVAFVRFDGARAERLARRIGEARHEAETFIEMAEEACKSRGAAAGTQPGLARSWLRAAYEAALGEVGWEQASLMGQVARAAAAVDPARARRAADHAGKADPKGVTPYAVAALASDLAAADPVQAERLLNWAIAPDYLLKDSDRNQIAVALIDVAVAVGDGLPKRTGRLIQLLQKVVRAFRSASKREELWSDWSRRYPGLGTHSPGVVRQLAEEYYGPCRDHMLRAAAAAYLPADVDRALEIADEITEAGLRDDALGDIAVAIARSAHPAAWKV
ncbi:serine/threonine-protein kinase [Streptomyces violaceusniger]|uniref:non-specific serine/threonine protein kinase n=1 Tax=Streptomyces violaceusniger (strain Tu 4113) TaxID=653045 RepID=G2PBV6_STRV4|nr:serine/threonine-protein kinase [Streptomyces violaceusniger]AEM81028.1 serine/threonine protein kinase [Streptomyces violaceusniger Tu 4113]